MGLMVGVELKKEDMCLCLGILNASVQYYNNGALSKATINMKCWSRKSISIIRCIVYETRL